MLVINNEKCFASFFVVSCLVDPSSSILCSIYQAPCDALDTGGLRGGARGTGGGAFLREVEAEPRSIGGLWPTGVGQLPLQVTGTEPPAKEVHSGPKILLEA